MINEYSCPSCGSNLSYNDQKEIFRCEYCGKIFTDAIDEIDLKLIEELRQKKRTTEARRYVELLLEKDPDDFYLNWEWFNTVYLPGPPSRYISANCKDTKKMYDLGEGHALDRLRKTIPDDMRKYIDDLEQLTFMWQEIDGLTVRMEQIRKRQVYLRNESARQRIPEDDPIEKMALDFNSIQGYVLFVGVICLVIIMLLGANPWLGVGAIALLAGGPFLIRWCIKRSKEKRMEKTSLATNASLNEAKAMEEKITYLKEQAGDIKEEARSYEDKFIEIISR